MPTTVITRDYNGPFMTSNATSLRVGGNLEVRDHLDAASINVATDVHVTGLITTDDLNVNNLVINQDLKGAANILLDNYIKANYAFANISTFGRTLDTYANAESNVYVTNSIKRSLHGSIWLGSGSAVEVAHGLDVDPNLYTVIATLCDTSDTQQIVTPQVTDKGANSFWIKCIPENGSNTASVNFMINELVVQHFGINEL